MAINDTVRNRGKKIKDEVCLCNICGSSEQTVLYQEHEAQIHQIVKCMQCDLMYAYPVHGNNINNYDVKEQSAEQYTWETPQIQHAKIKAKDYEDIASYLDTYFPMQGRILEVGSSTGIFLDYMQKKGWDVVGVEPNGSAVNFAKQMFGIETYQATLESAPIPNDSIEAAVLLHVIEHLDDPASAIKDVFRLLKPGGIFVAETPTYDSFAFKLLGRRERSLNCNGHIFFFTKKTLSELMERHGFRVLETKKVGRTLSISRLLWNLGVMSKSKHIQRFFDGITQRFNLDDKLIYINARDMIRIYCQKE